MLRPAANIVMCGYGNDGSIDDNRPLTCPGGYPWTERTCLPGCGSPPQFCNPANPHDEGSWNTCASSSLQLSSDVFRSLQIPSDLGPAESF